MTLLKYTNATILKHFIWMILLKRKNQCDTCINVYWSHRHKLRSYLWNLWSQGEIVNGIISLLYINLLFHKHDSICHCHVFFFLISFQVSQVINYNFPYYMSDYIHRVGRVGRLGSESSGKIINLIGHRPEVSLVWEIEVCVINTKCVTCLCQPLQ